MALLDVKNVKKIYTTRFGGQSVQALKDVSFSVEPREYVAVMGESGSGKTTLLNILAALDKPTSGKVLLKGEGCKLFCRTERICGSYGRIRFRKDNSSEHFGGIG